LKTKPILGNARFEGAPMQAQAVLGVIASAVLLTPAVLAQAVERTTNLQPFNSLELRSCFDTKVAPGTPERVVINATPEQHDRIAVEQQGSTVEIGLKNGWQDGDVVCRGGRVQVQVTASFAGNEPFAIHSAGSGNVDAEVPAASKLTTQIAGSGNLALRGAADECELSVSGSGDVGASSLDCARAAEVEVAGSGSVTMRGKTKDCEFEIHGSGDVHAQDYACDSADVEVNGSGSVDLAAIGALDVEIHGSGDVTYSGEPQLRGMDVHGSGRVRKR
jgi:hypothetical protein